MFRPKSIISLIYLLLNLDKKNLDNLTFKLLFKFNFNVTRSFAFLLFTTFLQQLSNFYNKQYKIYITGRYSVKSSEQNKSYAVTFFSGNHSMTTQKPPPPK